MAGYFLCRGCTTSSPKRRICSAEADANSARRQHGGSTDRLTELNRCRTGRSTSWRALPDSIHPRGDPRRGIVGVLVLPYAQYRPSGIVQAAGRVLVAPAGRADLVAPPLTVCPGPGHVVGASVPEAAVHEHRQPETRKHDVGSSRNRPHGADVDAVPVAEGVQPAADGHLRRGVTSALRLQPETVILRRGLGDAAPCAILPTSCGRAGHSLSSFWDRSPIRAGRYRSPRVCRGRRDHAVR